MGHVVMTFGGTPEGTTVKIVSTNAAQTLVDLAAYTNVLAASVAVMGAIVTCEDNDIRFTLGGVTPTAALGHMLYAGQSLQLGSGPAVRTFQFISAVVGAHGNLVVTPLREKG